MEVSVETLSLGLPIKKRLIISNTQFCKLPEEMSEKERKKVLRR